MKIEKISENQIRCTLTHHDLADRKLKISELAYGSEKAKSLFKDMMEQASSQFGFEADDIPLMVEAVPINAECIVLTITKVEDPEELDTRFSQFAPSVHEESSDDSGDGSEMLSAEEIMNLMQELHEEIQEKNVVKDTPAKGKDKILSPEVKACAFRFDSLDSIIELSHVMKEMQFGSNTLYKNKTTGEYVLVIPFKDITAMDFNKFCNVTSEFGYYIKQPYNERHYQKHFEILIRDNALKALSQM